MCYNSTEYRFEWFWNELQSRCAGPTQMLNSVGGLSRLRSWDQGTSAGTVVWLKVQSLTHINPIPLFKNFLARIMQWQTQTSRLFIFYCLHVQVTFLVLVTWKSGFCHIVLLSKIFHSKIEWHTGCGPQHWSWGTAVFKISNKTACILKRNKNNLFYDQ